MNNSLVSQGGQKRKERLAGLDVIRVFAIFSVIAGHFFVLNTPFLETVFEGLSMFVQGMAMFLFCATGVPLFIMMTGFLNSNKVESSADYYRGIFRVLGAYLLFSVITILFRIFYLGEELSLVKWVLKILDFSAIPYGWYIEMWIGLYLLTPFLNLMYKSIPSKKQKLLLIITLFALTALPDLLNRYGLHLVPGFWKFAYPLTYYFIGSYIREFEPVFTRPLHKWFAVGTVIATCAISPLFSTFFAVDRGMIQIAGGPFGVFGFVVAVLMFLLLYKVDIRNIWLKGSIARVSLLSLDMYLCCWIFDKLIYPYFKSHFFVNQSQFGIWFFVIVPLVFISSFAAAWLKEQLFKVPDLFMKKAA